MSTFWFFDTPLFQVACFLHLFIDKLCSLPLFREMSLVGLLFVAIGAGGLRPCVTAFGGDQFQLPEQEKELKSFFTYYYIVINIGLLVASSISPIFRY